MHMSRDFWVLVCFSFFPFSAYSYKRGSLTRLGLSWEPATPRGVDLSLPVQGTLGLQVHLAFYVGAEDLNSGPLACTVNYLVCPLNYP